MLQMKNWDLFGGAEIEIDEPTYTYTSPLSLLSTDDCLSLCRQRLLDEINDADRVSERTKEWRDKQKRRRKLLKALIDFDARD